MSTSRTLEGCILTPQGFLQGEIAWDAEGRIVEITGNPIAEDSVRPGAGDVILPGFIDLHVHGGAGRDIMEGGDAALTVARCHARHGTTALLATTMTAPTADIEQALRAVRPLCDDHVPGAARVLGVHLEGPYINPGKLGAQPDHAKLLSIAELDRLNAIAPIRLVTLAPELPGHMEAVAPLTRAGYCVQLGHTLGSYEQGRDALAQGARGFTHLFNAMTGLHHREPGMVGAALAHAQYAEFIPDLLHVHPGAILAALRAIPCAYCVTDSTAAAAMPDGDYRLGSHTVTKCLGGVRLADGTLAGSALTMDAALRNLVERLGLGLADASKRVSTHAADYLGLADRGRLQAGAWADLVVLDTELALQGVVIEGRTVDLQHAD